MARRKPFISVDTETTGPDLHHGCLPFAVSMMTEKGKGYLWQWEVNPTTRIPKIPRADKTEIREIIQAYTPVFHNIKFDSRALLNIGIKPTWLDTGDWEDTLIASHVLGSEYDHGLKDQAFFLLDIDDEDEEALREAVRSARVVARHTNKLLTESGRQPKYNLGPSVAWDYWLPHAVFKSSSPERAALEKYALKDAERTILLWMNFSQALRGEKLYDVYLREKNLLPVVFQMEQRGITLDKQRLSAEILRYQERANENLLRCDIIARRSGYENLNPNSNPQLADILYDYFGLPILSRTKGGKPSTNASSLRKLLGHCEGNPKRFLTNLLEAKRDLNAVTYLEGYRDRAKEWGPDQFYKAETYRIHPSLNQNGAKTTRFTHSSPNSANVSKGDEDAVDEEGNLIGEGDRKLRTVFGPATYPEVPEFARVDIERIWYSIDYQQLQLRIFAFAAEDKSMIEAFAQGYNFHEFVASCIFDCEPSQVTKLQKRIGKNVNFGFIFGAGPSRIEATAGIPGLWDTVTKLFPSAHRFMQSMMKQARQRGCIYTAGGYRLGIPSHKPYIATNYYVQGSEGDIVKNAMIELQQYLANYPGHYMAMQVHDELVFDFPRSNQQQHPSILLGVKKIMEKAGEDLGFITPVNIEVSPRDWAHAFTLNLQENPK